MVDYEKATRFLDDLSPEQLWSQEEVKRYKKNRVKLLGYSVTGFYHARGFNRDTHPQKKMEALIEYFDALNMFNDSIGLPFGMAPRGFDGFREAIARKRSDEGLIMLERVYSDYNVE